MGAETKPKGRWVHRMAIRLFTLVLAVLFYWVLGFLIDDIRSIRGPEYAEIEKQYLQRGLVDRQAALDRQIEEVARQIENQTEKQRLVGDSSRSLQQTINQLVELQKLGLQKSVPFSATEQANFTSSLNLFLDNQRKYQELSQAVSDLVEQKQKLVRERQETAQALAAQALPARARFDALTQRHRLKLALVQLGILVPILAAAGVLVVKKRGSLYFPLFLAFGAAVLLKVGVVVHEYFPRRYFKYILIGVLSIVVARLLVHFIRTIAFPKTSWLVRQYREAYERFLCPVCEYPIRTGPRRFLFWTRRTVNKAVPRSDSPNAEEAYTCPSCGTRLFDECPSCHKIRHMMLPHCSHCGAEKEIR